MTTFKRKVAIIGCGRIAGHHCRAVQNTKELELAAVCDLEGQKAEQYATTFGIPHFKSYYEMLQTIPDIDIVVVATPSGMHFEHTMDILETFKKHVVIEKPTFLKASQIKTAYDCARKNKVSLFPVFQNRYNVAVQRVRNALREGELGKVYNTAVRVRWCRPQRYYDMSQWRGTFSMDGGALTNQGIHHVDLLRYLGGDVKSVSALMKTHGSNIEVEDTVVASFLFESGATGVLEVTTSARPHDFEASLSFVCERGLAQLGGIAVNELQLYSPAPEECAKHSEDFSGCVYGNGHFELYKDVVSHLEGEQEFPVNQEDCTKTLRLLHAFYLAAETGSWVDPSDGQESEKLGRFDEKLSKLYRTPCENERQK